MPRFLFGILLPALLAAPAAAEWKSLVDPPAEKIDWPADYKLDVALPRTFFEPDIVYADGGPFAIVGRHGKGEAKVVIDLRSGKLVGTLPGELKIDAPYALSRDGKRFAATAHGFRGATVVVFDVSATAPKVLGELSVEGKPDSLQFVGPDKVLTYTGKRVAQVYDLKANGKQVAEVKVEGSPWRHAVPFATPGGKYIGVPDTKFLRFHDADTGAEVALLPGPKQQDGNDQNFDGLSVSPDGTKLAAVMEAWNKRQLVIIDLATGKTLAVNKVEAAGAPFYNGQKIVWTLDGSGVLFHGGTVLDPMTAKAIFTPAAEGWGGTRYPISLGAVVGVTKVGQDRHLRAVTLPADKVAAVKAAVQSGGNAADALLPNLVAASTAGAKTFDVPLAAPGWSLKPDAAPGTTAGQRPVPLGFDLGGCQSLRVTGGAKPVAVFETAATAAFGEPDNNRPRTVRRVDLTTGKLTGTIELPPGCAVEDLAADGSAVVTVDTATRSRADVFPLDGGKPTGIRPYDAEPGDGRKVAYAAVLAPGRVLTVSGAGTLAVWDLGSGKAAYVAHAPGFTPAGMTAGRRYVFGFQGNAVRFFDAATGDAVGDLVLGFVPVTAGNAPRTPFVKPDGSEAAAVLVKSGAGAVLVRWDLSRGAQIDETPLKVAAAAGKWFEYAGNGILTDGRELFDPARKAVIWAYSPPPAANRFSAQRPDGRTWYAVSVGSQGSLVAADLPGKAAEAQVASVADGAGAVLKPGAKVALALDFTGTNASDGLKKAPDALKTAWAANGIEVADSADITVQVRVTERDTGERMEFTTVRGFMPVSPFAAPSDIARAMEVTIETTVRVKGQPVWVAPPAKHTSRPAGRFNVPKEDKTVDVYLTRVMWDNVPGWAAMTLPRFLTKTPDGFLTLPGYSAFTAGGVIAGK